MKYFDINSATKRYLAEFAKLKAAHPGMTNSSFMESIGYANGSRITDLIYSNDKYTHANAKHKHVNLPLLVNTKLVYPEFDADYVLYSDDEPEVHIPSEQGRKKGKNTGHRKGKAQLLMERQIVITETEQAEKAHQGLMKEMEVKLKQAGRKAEAAKTQEEQDQAYEEQGYCYTRARESYEKLEAFLQQAEQRMESIDRQLRKYRLTFAQ